MNNHSSQLLYLNSREVLEICNELDSVNIIKKVFINHALKNTMLPDEAYLSWKNDRDESVRSLNMPGYIGGKYNAVGTKIINSNILNTKRGIARANGITVLFDQNTGIPNCIMEGAYISSLRTASVSILGIMHLKTSTNLKLGIIGMGVQGDMHLKLISKYHHNIESIWIYDQSEEQLVNTLMNNRNINHKISIAKNSKEVFENSNVIVTTTTVDKGYIKQGWINKGTLIIHVSLDDLLPEAIKKADKLVVDDWGLVMNDDRRIFGKMHKKGLLNGLHMATKHKPYIYAELGEIIVNKLKGRVNNDEIIILNPFGLAIEDIMIAHHVYSYALKKGLGIKLPR